MARTLRWLIAAIAAGTVFLLTWYGLATGWHWGRGDALGPAAAALALVLAPLGWWAALPIGPPDNRNEIVVKAEGRSGPGSQGDPVRFGAIPAALPAFEPREELLERLRANSGIDQAAAICAVTGLRGAGKTQLAGEYVRDRISAGWSLVAWIDAEEPVQMIGQLVALADRLNLRRSDDEDAPALTTRLRDWLQARTEPALLVFDNALDPEALTSYLPATGTTQIVITSTEKAFAKLGAPIDVQPFPSWQAISFLHRVTELDDPIGAKAIAEELGNLPLALAQAAALIAEQSLDYKTYLRRLRDQPLVEYLVRPFGGPYPRGAAYAILLSLASVENDNHASLCQSLIEIIAMLAPTGTRRELLYQAFDDDSPCSRASGNQEAGDINPKPEPLQVHPSARDVDEAIARLARASLLTSSGDDGSTIHSHRLVMRVVRERIQAQQQQVLVARRAVAALDKELKTVGENAWTSRAVVTELVSHANALWDHTSRNEDGQQDDEELTRDLLTLRLDALGSLLEIRDSAAGVLTAEGLVSASKEVFGPYDPLTLRADASLATAYIQAGRLDEAIMLRSSTFKARERVLGKDSPDTIQSLSDLASAYRQAGRLNEALKLHEDAIAAADRVLGEDDPSILRFRSNLAFAYRKAGRLSEAMAIYEKVLASRERVLGLDHRDTMRSRASLASVYLDKGWFDKAAEMYEQTLAARERVLGGDHPDTVESRNDLAIARRKTGDIDQAIGLHGQNVAIRERLLGIDHRDTLRSRSNLAFAYRMAGRTEEAIPMFEEILAIRKRVSGDGHPDTLRAWGNLAGAYQDAGQFEKAIKLHRQTLDLRERILGADHPDTLRSLSNLGSALRRAGEMDGAIPILESAFTGRSRVLGSDHPDTLKSKEELALAQAEVMRASLRKHNIAARVRKFCRRSRY